MWIGVAQKQYWRELSKENTDFFLAFLADSSPLVGKEWLLMEMYLILQADAEKFVEAMDELISLADSDDKARKAELSKIMQKCILHHVLIPTALGALNQGLAAKFSAVLHAMRTEADDWATVQKILKCMLCITTDYCVESSLYSVPTIDANTLYTDWREDTQILDDSFQPDDLPGPAFQEPHKDVSLGSALRVPGIEHLLHNALDQIMDHLHFFKEWFENARELGRCLGNAFYTDRFVHHF